MTLELGQIFVSLGNLGVVGLLAWRVVKSVDAHSETLPVVLEQLKTLTANQEKVTKSVRTLYNSRNEQEKRLTVVETVHKIKGCNDV